MRTPGCAWTQSRSLPPSAAAARPSGRHLSRRPGDRPTLRAISPSCARAKSASGSRWDGSGHASITQRPRRSSLPVEHEVLSRHHFATKAEASFCARPHASRTRARRRRNLAYRPDPNLSRAGLRRASLRRSPRPSPAIARPCGSTAAGAANEVRPSRRTPSIDVRRSRPGEYPSAYRVKSQPPQDGACAEGRPSPVEANCAERSGSAMELPRLRRHRMRTDPREMRRLHRERSEAKRRVARPARGSHCRSPEGASELGSRRRGRKVSTPPSGLRFRPASRAFPYATSWRPLGSRSRSPRRYGQANSAASLAVADVVQSRDSQGHPGTSRRPHCRST